MLFDKQGLFSDKQTVLVDDLSEQTVDLYKGDIVTTPYISDVARDIGRGTPLPIRVQRTADGASAMTIDILSGATVDGNNDIETPTVIATLTIVELPAGSFADFQFMPQSKDYGRYLQLRYKVAGEVTSGFVTGHDQPSHI